MILIIDNYDSFTYNLVQYIGEVTNERLNILVKRNNLITIKDIEEISPLAIIISPGPCTPKEAGISLQIVKNFSGNIPILGVCLGHQVIGEAFGGKVIRSTLPMHGKTSEIVHNNKSIFSKLNHKIVVGRYHSLIVDRESFPESLEILAETTTSPSEIMALRHREHQLTIGLQFHPESILTSDGKVLLKEFFNEIASPSHYLTNNINGLYNFK